VREMTMQPTNESVVLSLVGGIPAKKSAILRHDQPIGAADAAGGDKSLTDFANGVTLRLPPLWCRHARHECDSDPANAACLRVLRRSR
jgi:hypothetical protein